MRYQAMQVIYHSPVCPKPLKRRILQDARAKKYVEKDEDITAPHYFPALSQIDQDKFLDHIKDTPFGKLLNNSTVLQAL
jgi:hypothetical protein